MHATISLSIIAGTTADQPANGEPFHAVCPATGRQLPTPYYPATDDQIDRAATLAAEAFDDMDRHTATDRADLLDTMAQQIDDLGDALITVCHDETGLTHDRIVAETGRTTSTLRMFARLVREGSWVGAIIDRGDPDREPTPRPDLRRMLRPLGPVVVFGASNFPLAYSVAGGDTASALAAGCPVIVKGHPAHPGTGRLVAGALTRAVADSPFCLGTFSFLHAGGSREKDIGAGLIRHPAVRAVGFTGSVAGGYALDRIARERTDDLGRPDPIPVFAEMGSTNPVFVLPGAVCERADRIAPMLVGSACAANGQMCTCPGLILAIGDDADTLAGALAPLFAETDEAPMVCPNVLAGYKHRLNEVTTHPGVAVLADELPSDQATPIRSGPVLLATTYERFKADAVLREEIFGSAAIIIRCDTEAELLDATHTINGSLTGTIHWSDADADLARQLAARLERRVGRLIHNGVPTGVEVTAAMVHGGPHPATNQPHTTAVGPLAITRWCRPVAYQNATILPMELQDENPMGIRRRVDGVVTREAV